MGRVLIADDAAFMRAVIRELLERNGHTVVGEAINGEIAANLYKETRPDLVIMDITMPEVDGIEGIKRIISFDPQAKIVVCSALAQKSFVVDSIKHGAKDFVSKPFEEIKLIETINRYI